MIFFGVHPQSSRRKIQNTPAVDMSQAVANAIKKMCTPTPVEFLRDKALLIHFCCTATTGLCHLCRCARFFSGMLRANQSL